ncbi:MAG: response regulator transcription factor [Anaerolineales bacterium]
MIRVFLVDDHAIVRHGLRDILLAERDIAIAGEAEDGMTALASLHKTPADVVVLDIALPDISGMELLSRITALPDAPRVLILSMYPETQYAVRTLKAGAAGYLTKNSAPGELVTAVRKAAQGGRYINMALAEHLAASLGMEKPVLPHETLSNREFQVFLRLGQGQSLNEIAGALGLSPKTISTYRTRIMGKMNFKNNAELVRYAIEHKLIL